MPSTTGRKREGLTFNPATLGILLDETPAGTLVSEPASTPIYVEVKSLTDKSAVIATEVESGFNGIVRLAVFDLLLGRWCSAVATSFEAPREDSNPGRVLSLQFLTGRVEPLEDCIPEWSSDGPLPQDVLFLVQTRFLRSIPDSCISLLLNRLRRKVFKKGELIIRQGDIGDNLYIIHRGSCSVQIVQDGESHPLTRLREGDIIGEMAILTGALRRASIYAESEMELWALGQNDFEDLSSQHPELRIFLTEIVTNRFEVSPYTADRLVGKYVIKKKLGVGGWSIVYHGVHRSLNTHVAIKMLKHTMAMEPRFSDHFWREARVVAQLSHRNIVQVYDFEELYHTKFIIMEFLEGESLDSILVRHRVLPDDKAANILIQVCSGLEYAHTRGIIHQDIKPANICILPDGQVKILDFGLACPAGHVDPGMPGTMFYMAPEQVQGLPVDMRTDIYSLGIVAYEMVTGSRPYPEDDLNAHIDMRLTQDVPDPAILAPRISEPLREFIIKACSRDPGSRHRTSADALANLMRVRQTIEEVDPTAGNGQSARQKMSPMYLFYPEERQAEVNRLLEEIRVRAQAIGVKVKISEFLDL